MLTVACVLRSGGIYEPWHVRALRDGVRGHLPLPYRFVCLSDVPVDGAETVELTEPWPGWWAKIALWRPGLFDGRVLYFDLDTAFVGDLSDIASYSGPFAMMNDLGLPVGGREYGASGVMAWTASDRLTRDIYETFSRVSEGAMRNRPTAGDQHWIAGSVEKWDCLRALYPGQIVSWKLHVQRIGTVPKNARVVCWHGYPKPWDIGWVKREDYMEAA